MIEKYSLNGDIVNLAVQNKLTMSLNNVAVNLGLALRPFCFCATRLQETYGVLDLASLSLENDGASTIFDDIVAVRKQQLSSSGVFLPTLMTDDMKKFLFFDYLLSVSVCYIEVPKNVVKNSRNQLSYDKFIATNNMELIAKWLGEPIEVVRNRYSSPMRTEPLNYINMDLKFAKLSVNSSGFKVTIPRKPVHKYNISCIPLFMLDKFTDGLEKNLKEKILEFKFEKDNGSVREINSTLNWSIMSNYYNDKAYVDGVFARMDMFPINVDGISLSAKQSRGYIKVPELGASKYDLSGNRSLNIARILSIREVKEVDRTYIDVDLNSVIANFSTCLNFMYQAMQDQIIPMLSSLMEQPANPNWTVGQAYEYAIYWVNEQNLILTTTFKKQLHKFMILNPQWFPNYTGKPSKEVVGEMPLSFGASQGL